MAKDATGIEKKLDGEGRRRGTLFISSGREENLSQRHFWKVTCTLQVLFSLGESAAVYDIRATMHTSSQIKWGSRVPESLALEAIDWRPLPHFNMPIINQLMVQ